MKVGVTVDLCDRCRGMWLDRGELEKIVAELRDLADREQSRPRDEARPRAPVPGRLDDDDDGDERGPRRQSAWRRMLELFD